MRTIDKIITPVNCQYGAPLGRRNVGHPPKELFPDMSDMEDVKDTLHFNWVFVQRKKKLNKHQPKVFNCAVPMIDRAYDRGGAYWGAPERGIPGYGQLRVRYTKDLSYVEFYRI